MDLTASHNRAGRFYAIVGLAISAIVLLGFSRTYYLRPWFDVPPLTPRLHLHGLMLTLWLLLFLVQTTLIAAGRRRVHMRLGIAGVALAVLVVATTYAAAIEAARLGEERGGITSANRLYSSVLILILFSAFVAIGAALRRRTEAHKRLMLLAVIAIVGPGANRAVAVVVGHGVRDFHVLVITTLVSIALLYDWRRRGRPHTALVCGGVLLIVSQLTRRFVGGSELWTVIGNWLIG
jgi:hypothetical protein